MEMSKLPGHGVNYKDAGEEPIYFNFNQTDETEDFNGSDTSDEAPMYLTLKSDPDDSIKVQGNDDKGSKQPPDDVESLPAAAAGIQRRLKQRTADSEQHRNDVKDHDDAASEVFKQLYEHVSALEASFRRLFLAMGFAFLFNLALVIYLCITEPPLEEVPTTTPYPADVYLDSSESWKLAPLSPTLPVWKQLSFTRGPSDAPRTDEDLRFVRATFTTLGATGRAGPTSLDDHYRGQDHEKLVTLQNGIQLFTVPETGNYRIEVAGAAGGWDYHSLNASVRGHGALMRGAFCLRKGEVLKILVGQEGLGSTTRFSSGGGGGTFVTRLDDTPLIIAGGGGGIEWLEQRYASCDGTTLPSGQRSYKGAVRRAGNPGDEMFAGGAGGNGATDGRGAIGGGGGGFLTNGGSGWDFDPTSGTSGGEGGYAFVNGGQGGRGLYSSADGGFGGGGGAYGDSRGSGGGGGYSGGGRGPRAVCECGGGGGSFNAGTDTSGKNGTNDGPGYAVIVRMYD